MDKLNWQPMGFMSEVAYSDYGRYEVVPTGNVLHVKRNGRVIHIAGDFDAATDQAQIDHDDRARKIARR
jgi:predicted metal-dependent phosphoesterase TrpH